MAIKDNFCKRSGKVSKNNLIVLFSVLLLIMLSGFVFAIPDSLTLQGKLTNAAGSSLTGTYTMVFRIYDIPGFSYYNVSNQTDESNTVIVNTTYINYTNILWESNRSVTTDGNGIYDVILQNLSSLNFSDQYYLGIMVGNDNESVPRINLTSSPYAFRANISEGLNRKNRYEVSVLNITGNLTLGESFADVLTVVTGRLNISDGNIISAGNLSLAERITFSLGSIIDNLVNGFLRISSGLNVTGNVSIAQDTLFVDNTSGRVGIGTTIPYNTLTVIGSVGVSGSLNASSINVTGNAYFATASGSVGIGTTTPADTLTIIGSVSTFGSLNATYINATEIRQGTNLVQTINAVFNLLNLTNYFGDSGFNGSVLRVGNISNILESTWDWDNASLVLDNGSIIRTGNLSAIFLERNNSLWNASGSNIFLREITGNVGIGTTIPYNTLTVIGSVGVSGSLNASSINVTGNAYFATASGSVGIGNTIPNATLDVSGNIYLSAANPYLNLSGPIIRKSGNDIVISD